MGCDDGHESSQESFIESMEEGWDEVGKRMKMTRKKDENEVSPEGSVIEGDQGS